jgi:hypothetical protein
MEVAAINFIFYSIFVSTVVNYEKEVSFFDGQWSVDYCTSDSHFDGESHTRTSSTVLVV